ncbi:DUF397 domain-containing protein [Streptomyces mobaraensis]|uniref:DUF397 domain-containing protein n=1 Tax=Streptomyces mobaraensis TaxID=35621 RepID=UPI0033C8EF68
MPAQATHGLRWRKSTYSGNSGQCIEISIGCGDRVLIRDSKFPCRSELTVDIDTWRSFVGAVKAGLEASFEIPVVDGVPRLEDVSGVGAG